jgi:ribulose-phosphate 3-epimerase
VLVAPSLLAADFTRLGQQIVEVEAAGADMLHVDVMDGHFVPNLSMGPPVVKAIRSVSHLPFDVHLMLTDPQDYVEPFVQAGADHITIHVEIDHDVNAILDSIHAQGCSAGLSLRPMTPASSLAPYLDKVDLILVMTVEPGFGGQSFREDVVPKIGEIHRMLQAGSRPVHLQVDGGVSARTAPAVIGQGALVLVAGTSVFRAPDGMAAAVAALRSAAG